MRALPRIVAETTVGRAVPVVVWRDGKEQTLNVTVGELPAEAQQAAASPTAPATRPTELAGPRPEGRADLARDAGPLRLRRSRRAW